MRLFAMFCCVFLVPACFSNPPSSERATTRRVEPTITEESHVSETPKAKSSRKHPRPGEVVYYRLNPNWEKVDKACGARDRSYVVRHVNVPPRTRAPLTAAVKALLDFWGARPSQVEEVSILDGRATLSLASMKGLDGVNTSCGSVAFIGSLRRTVFQFDSVQSFQIHLEGSCKKFGNYMEVGKCRTIMREA